MRTTLLWVLTLTAAAIAAAVGGGWLPLSKAKADAVPASNAQGTGAPSQMQALLATPQARDYRQRQQFQRDAQRFFRDARNLGPVARSQRAQVLERKIDAYENAGELSAGETMLLRVGLIQATVADPAEQAVQVEALAQRYRADAARRNAQWQDQQQRDPRFRDYKQRERDVIAEVLAMQRIPGGLSRDEYLRQRLQAERERAYR
ncbi:hypothetical protein [Lysobacter sp. Hz 25]|uniref:hypothetical protein n=1 Tax=Lysobacter sp. Hz 25 TaxID=3383698 RepID=UPI0038D4D9C6